MSSAKTGLKGLAAVMVLASYAAQAADPLPGIIGSDDRTITNDPRFNAVGRLNLSGTGFCTATLIAPSVIATAAHCTYYKRTGKPIPADRIHFAAGWRQGKPVVHRLAKHVRRHPGYSGKGPMAADIALIVLEQPIPANVLTPIPMDRSVGRLRMVVPLTLVSYARDRPHLPTVESGCVVRAEQARLLLTDCDSNFGGSGAPVLREVDGKLAVLGVVSGVVEQNGLRRVAVVRAHWKEQSSDER